MWNNYFYQLRKKYSMRLSTKTPLVINLDGKNVTRNKSLNIIDLYDSSFLNNLEKTAKYFSEKYKCIAILGADEISFIFENPTCLINDLNSDNSNYSTEIISVFSQYFYDYFNNFDTHRKIFWHGKCFSIPSGKINSYVKYKSKLIQVLVTTYFLKKHNIVDAGKIPLQKKLDMCENYEDYPRIKNIENGILFYNGDKIDINKFLDGKLEKIDIIDDSIFDNILDINNFRD
ncbi:MAG: hypothetical protein IJH39_07125 [Clostridia bacterium]|nr:hypothetical protein [Clostridia bacterium]